MNITLAESAGFCFGVSRAVKMVEDLLEQGETVATLGPIIHNPQIVERFRKRGVSIIESPDEAEADSVVVIRSHGVSAQIYEQLLQKGVRIADATCPFVSKIHQIVAEATRDGRTVLIAGDRNHPEVEGICGHCRKTPQGEDSFIVFRDAQETAAAEMRMSASIRDAIFMIFILIPPRFTLQSLYIIYCY